MTAPCPHIGQHEWRRGDTRGANRIRPDEESRDDLVHHTGLDPGVLRLRRTARFGCQVYCGVQPRMCASSSLFRAIARFSQRPAWASVQRAIRRCTQAWGTTKRDVQV